MESMNTDTEWKHDNCGGKVDTTGIYWKCEKCGSFVYVAICNGNSDTLKSLSEIPDNPTGDWAEIKRRRDAAR